jgi:acetoin:2,6-dichlorophenolindophenol oxidoreductase subunit beta
MVTVEEGTAGWSWGSEVATLLTRDLFGQLRGPVVVASEPTAIPPAREREGRMLVGSGHIEAAIRSVA